MGKIPLKLLNIIEKRKDLIDLGFLETKNERRLIVWVIIHGLNEYSEIFRGDFSNNNIIRWLTSGSSIKRFQNMPKIFLGLWDIHKSHRRRWPFPELNKFYMIWLEKNWHNFEIELPDFENLFNKNLNTYNLLEVIIFDLFWNIRKPFSIFLIKYFGIGIDYFFAKKLYGWNIQINVVQALVYRELKTRVSQVKGGILGVFIEPLGVMSIFLVIFSILRTNNGPLDILLFLGSGIVLFTLFSDIAIRSSNGMLANEALFFYRPVKPIDTVIARTIVESGLFGIVYLVIISGTFLIRQKIILEDIGLLTATFLAVVTFAFGIGLVLIVVTHIYPSVIQLIPLAMRPLWFLSGVFISLNSIPQSLRPFLSWNPIFQAIEISRFAFTKNYFIDNSLISISYLWQCSILSVFIGMWVYSSNEKKLLTR